MALSLHRSTVLAAAAGGALIGWLSGCGSQGTEPASVATTITLDNAHVLLDGIGASTQLGAAVRDQRGAAYHGASLSWASTNAAVATVNGSGLITAVAPGAALIVVSTAAIADTADVTVTQTPRAIDVVDGNNQAGTVGQSLALAVVVQISDGRAHAIAGTPVGFSILSGGGAVGAHDSVTGADGRARATWVLGTTAGTQRLTAAISGTSVSATLTAAAVAGPPAQLLAAAGDAQQGLPGMPLRAPISVLATDSYGNGVPNQAVSFAVTEGGGATEQAAATTDATGHAGTSWILGPSGAQSLEARLGALAPAVFAATTAIPSLDLARELDANRTLMAWTETVLADGHVLVNGSDLRQPGTPFLFDWDDGQVTEGFFPQIHAYATTAHNYLVRVTARYSTADRDSTDVPVRFVAPQFARQSVPPALAVTIPAQLPALTSRQAGYTTSSNLAAFDDASFTTRLGRGDIAYVLSEAAVIQAAVLENDFETPGGAFNQVVVEDPFAPGAYTLWFTTPVALAVHPGFIAGTPSWSSLFHEMGHNVSLNAPAGFRYGGRIDGNANAIYSEAVAQMLQHTVAWEMANHPDTYGLSADVALDVANSARGTVRVIRNYATYYIGQAAPFVSWNDPATSTDEAEPAFKMLARQFIVHAEQAHDYVGPLTRMMRLLRTFDDSLLAAYAPQQNSPAADTARATLMVAALSYGFRQDLRAEFRALRFPIDDAAYTRLYASVP